MSSRTRHAVTIWGAYGGMNIGDEAILNALIGLLRSRGKDELRLVTQRSPEPDQLARYRTMGIEPISFRQPRRLLKAMADSNLVCGGGQLMDDRGRIGFPVGYTAILIVLNRILGGKPVLFGIGAEPVSRRMSRWLVRHGYSRAGSAMMRDDRSYQAIIDAGYPAERATIGGDIALTLDLPHATGRPENPLVLVVPNRDAQRVDDLGGIFTDVVGASAERGYKVTVMAHDRRTEYDAGEVARLEAEFGDAAIEFVVPGSLEDALRWYGQSDVVVSARMHPLVLSLLHGLVPVAIPVVEKVQTLASELNLPAIPRDKADPATIDGAIDQALADSVERIEATLETRRKAIESAADSVVAEWNGVQNKAEVQ